MNLLKFGKSLNITLVIVFLILIAVRILSNSYDVIDYQAFKIPFITISIIFVFGFSTIISLESTKVND